MTDVYFWRAKLVKGAPAIGVKTWCGPPLVDGEELDRSHRWQALVRNETTARAILHGEPVPIEIEGAFLRNIEPVTEADYLFLVQHSEWATQHAPDLPDASPTTAVDWNSTKLPF